MGRKRILVTAVTMFLAGGSLLVVGQPPGATGAPATTPVDACVAKYSRGGPDVALNPGQARKAVVHAGPANGPAQHRVTAVGGAGMTVTVTDDGAAVTAADDSDTAAMARAYAAQGRSVLEDARAAGVGKGLIRDLCEDALADAVAGTMSLSAAGDGTVFDSVCAHDDTGAVEWDGCATRYRIQDNDTNWNYGIDDAQAHGHETACCIWNDLHKGGVKNRYATSAVDITKATPGSDITDVNKCYTQSFGLTVAGFGASSGGTVCPDRWDITWPGQTTGTESHKTEWQGETNSDREALSMVGYRVKPGSGTAYSIVINWDVH